MVRASHLGDNKTFGGDADHRTTTRRHGPEAIEDDPWDAAQVGDSERYQGRRRASTARRRWLIVTLALVVLAGAITLALTWGSGDAPPQTSAATNGTPSPANPGTPGSPSPSSASTASPTPSAATASQSVRASSAIPQFATITVEAEAGSPLVSLSGSAQVQADAAASGGKIVGNLGAHGGGQQPGTLRVNNVSLPAAGVYRISIYYTNLDKPGFTSGTISVSGADSVTVKFTGGRGCCAVKEVDIAIPAGVHTITISNPTDIAPSVDKITLSRPA